MKNWLDELVEQHDELESPKSFWKWSALAAISAVVKDNIWLDRAGIFKTYPNIYVMLHAESGLKKGPPVAMAKKLVGNVKNTRIITGRSSIQGILKEMGTAYSQPGGKVDLKSVVFICSSELSSSIVEDKVATKILTDLYDRSYNEGDWKSLLKMENFQLKDPTVTMLTATNEAMSDDFFTRSAIQGGYFARTFIIYEKEGENSNSLVYDLETTPNYTEFSEYLKILSGLKGQFVPLASKEKSDYYHYPREKKALKGTRTVYFSETGVIYDDWYLKFKETIKTQEMRDETGTMNRFGDSVLKVAMLMALADQPNLSIEPHIMFRAIEDCEKLLGNVRKTTLGKQGLSQTSTLKTAIINELLGRENHAVTRTILMNKMWMHYDTTAAFDDMMLSFDQAGLIVTSSVGNNIVYTMPPNQVEQYKRFLAGKQK